MKSMRRADAAARLQPRMIMNTYPTGTVRELLKTDAVTPPTRQALERRYRTTAPAPKFFSAGQIALLRAAAARLVPQNNRDEPVDLAAEIDTRLAEGSGNGWRFAALPADDQTYALGLRGLEESAVELHGASFVMLAGEQQDDVLRCVQAGSAPGETWRTLDAPRFFEELLADLAEAYYAHPLAQEEIGYAGMADAPGWARIRLDELEDREPRSI